MVRNLKLIKINIKGDFRFSLSEKEKEAAII